MSLNGVRRKRLSQREGAKNSGLPGAMRPLDRGVVDTKINVHGATGQEANLKNFPGSGVQDPTFRNLPQAQGADPNIGNHTVSDVRTHVKGHGGSGPNCSYGKAMAKR